MYASSSNYTVIFNNYFLFELIFMSQKGNLQLQIQLLCKQDVTMIFDKKKLE